MYSALFLLLLTATQPSSVEMIEYFSDDFGTCKMTTPTNFDDLFLSNCRKTKHNQATCATALGEFKGAFVNRDPSEVTQSGYGNYLARIPINQDTRKFVFWSKTYFTIDLIRMLDSMGGIHSSLNSDPSFIVHEIRENGPGTPNNRNEDLVCWCSESGESGLIFNRICPNSTSHHFWAEFSTRFAEAARGRVFYVAEGLAEKAYRPESYFGCYELERLRLPSVTHFVALSLHPENSGESCNNDGAPNSFDTIRDIVRAGGAQYSCYDLLGEIKSKEKESYIVNTMADCVHMVISSFDEGGSGPDKQTFNCEALFPPTTKPQPAGKSKSVNLAHTSAVLYLVSLLALVVTGLLC